MRISNGILEREGEICIFGDNAYVGRNLLSNNLDRVFEKTRCAKIVGQGFSLVAGAAMIEFVSTDYDSTDEAIAKTIRRLRMIKRTEVTWDDPDSVPVDDDGW